MIWWLCVVLGGATQQERVCISHWEVESDCWHAVGEWTDKAIGWRERSKLDINLVGLCVPDTKVKEHEKYIPQ
jgi:hypothetical protein